MEPLKKKIIRSILQTLFIFVGSFLWYLITGDNVYIALKEAFAVFLIALLGLLVAEAAFWYQTK